MDKPVLFIGDVQQVEHPVLLIERLDKGFPDHHLVFLGDFLDSWYSTPLYQVKSLRYALDLVEGGRAEMVWSNHDAGYAFTNLNGWCSGFNAVTHSMVGLGPLAERMRKLIVPYVLIGEHATLVTHAGITDPLADILDVDITPELLLDWWAHVGASPYYWIGKSRGGRDRVGGPLWCDWQSEFIPLGGITQIVGHSHWSKIEHAYKSGGEAYNVDCLTRKGEQIVLELSVKGQFNEVKVP